MSKAQMRINTEEFPTLSRVEAYKIRFKTVNQKNELIETTGLVLLPPDVKTPLPFLSYQHATRMHTREAPTALPVDPEAYANAILHASRSSIVTMADYLGLDKINDSAQFYLNAEIQARVAYDLMQATKVFLNKINKAYLNEVFIAGYSQGAHNALGLHKYIQTKHAKEMKVLGTAAMSGIYGVNSLARQVLDQDIKLKINPVFVGLAIFGMHEAYDDFPRLSEILKPPYSETLPALMKKGNFSEVRKTLPDNVDEFLNVSKVLEIIYETDEHPFWKSLIKNDVDNFVPNAPVLMIHSPDDKVIPFSVAKSSYEKLKKLGANIKFVEVKDLQADHVDAAYPAFMHAARFFNGIDQKSSK
jgi:predicted esterase